MESVGAVSLRVDILCEGLVLIHFEIIARIQLLQQEGTSVSSLIAQLTELQMVQDKLTTQSPRIPFDIPIGGDLHVARGYILRMVVLSADSGS